MKTALILIVVAALGLGAWAWFNPEFADQVDGSLRDMNVKPKTTTVYKWRDAAGNWQITDQPPTDGTSYETLEYHRDANVMPADRFVGREE